MHAEGHGARISAMEANRRDFLKSGVLAAAPLFVPHSAFGANDRIAYGLIAAGGRGRYLNRNFQKLGAQCVALCDIYQPNLEAAKKDSPDGVKTYLDYHDLLAQTGIDAVVIASPDHHHCPMLSRRWPRAKTCTRKSRCRTRSKRARP